MYLQLNMSNLELLDHQKWVVDIARDYEGLWLKTGTGKTHTTFGLIEKHKPKNALVVVLKGKVADWTELSNELGIPIDVISKENFAKKWNDLPYYEFLAIDEIHYFWSMKMKTKKKKQDTIAGSLKKYLQKHSPKYFYGLTATPYRGSNPWDLYSAWYIFTGRVPMSYKEFEKEFFTRRDLNKWAKLKNPRVPSKWIPEPKDDPVTEKRLLSGFAKLGITLRSDEAFEMPPIIETKELFQPTLSQRRAYQDMLMENSEGIQRYTFGYQIYGGGCRKGDEYRDDEYYTSDKFEALMDMIDSEPRICVVARHHVELKRMREECALRFPDRPVYTVSGQDKRPDFKQINDDQHKDKPAIVLLQAESAVGFDIKNISLMVFYTLAFSYVHYEQARGRITRGKNVESFDSLRYVHMITMDTIDEHIHRKIMKKESFSIKLYAKKNKL